MQGLSYPMRFERGRFKEAAGIDKIKADVRLLLDTYPGEVFMNPEFGCRLKALIFEQELSIFEALAETYISEAIARFVPQVDSLDRITFTYEENVARITLLMTASETTFSMDYELQRGGGEIG